MSNQVDSGAFSIEIRAPTGGYPSWAPAPGQILNGATFAGSSTIEDVLLANNPNPPYCSSDPDLYIKSKCQDWTGGCTDGRYLYLPINGGHCGGSDNSVLRYGPLDTESDPDWVYLVPRSSGDATDPPAGNAEGGNILQDLDHYLDGKPSSCHTRGTLCVVPGPVFADGAARLFCVASHDPYAGNGRLRYRIDALNLATGQWEPPGTHPNLPTSSSTAPRGESCIFNPNDNTITVARAGGSPTTITYDPVGKAFSAPRSFSGPAIQAEAYATIAPDLQLMIVLGDDGNDFYLTDLANPGANALVLPKSYGRAGVVFCPVLGPLGTIVVWKGGRNFDLWEVPASYRVGSGAPPDGLNYSAPWSGVSATLSGDTPSTPVSGADHPYGKVQWVDPGFVLIADSSFVGPFICRLAGT